MLGDTLTKEEFDENNEPAYILNGWVNVISDKFHSLSARLESWKEIEMDEDQLAILALLLVHHLSNDIRFYRSMQEISMIDEVFPE